MSPGVNLVDLTEVVQMGLQLIYCIIFIIVLDAFQRVITIVHQQYSAS